MTPEKVFLAAACCFFMQAGWAQTTTVSPYSRYGLGEVQFPGSVKQTGMGRAGVAVADPDRINFLNPASYSELKMSTIEASIRADVTRNTTEGTTQTTNGSSIRYFSLGFPVVKGMWGAGFGIRPFSSTGYTISDIGEDAVCQCGRMQSTFAGDGDINAYFLGTGITPFSKRGERFRASALYDSLSRAGDTTALARHQRRADALSGLSIGINASWLFGTLNQTRSVNFLDSTEYLDTRVQNSLTLGDIYLQFGILYRRDLKDDGFFNVGVSGAPATLVRARRNALWFNYRSNDFFTDVRDTVEYVVDQRGDVNVPVTWSAGIAFGKKNKWTVGADFAMQQWADFSNFGKADSLQNSTAASAGFEVIPHFGGQRLLENIWYRFGAYYNSSYLQLKGTRINEFGITFGLGIPVLKADNARALSPLYQQKAVIQFAVEAGQQGAVSDGLVRQQYLRFHLGIVFKELWFIKRKYD